MKDIIKKKRMYEKGLSIAEIAEHFKTYPNKIKRELLKEGVALRDRSEVQVLALKNGRRKHPTKGKRRSAETREKISSKLADTWNNMDEDEKARRAATAKEIWDKRSPEEVKRFRSNIVKASREGSKLEKDILVALKNQGFDVIFHANHLVENENLHVDLYLPEKRVAIEVDGPSHYEPIWGEDALSRQRKSDLEKNGLLLGKKIRLARIRGDKKTVKYTAKVIADVLDFINSDRELEYIGE